MSTHEVVLPLFSAMSSLPEKRYHTLVADPPWRYDDKLGDGPKGAASHYPVMALHELYNMPVGLWAEKDSHLYLWTTNAFLEEAHRLAKGWGFTPRTVLTWIKGRLDIDYSERPPKPKLIQQIGLGHFFRNSTEHVLFAVRGKLRTRRADVPTAFIAERHEHSEKPAAFYDLVEEMSPGPYLDVFARLQRFGWDTFGNEAFDFREHGKWHDQGYGS